LFLELDYHKPIYSPGGQHTPFDVLLMLRRRDEEEKRRRRRKTRHMLRLEKIEGKVTKYIRTLEYELLVTT